MMETKTDSKKITKIFFSKPSDAKGAIVFKTVIWFITTIYVAYVISEGFTQNVFGKKHSGVCFSILFSFVLVIRNWRRYLKQR